MRILAMILSLAISLSALAQVRLDETSFPAAGQHSTLLHVEKLDRYSLSVSGGFGVTLAIVDPMSGPQAAQGELGISDGRLDLVLDAGTYKLLLEGPAEARGKATLMARVFATPPGEPQVLEDLKVVESQLDDLEQRQYWIVLDQPEHLRLELMGRNLADAKLWLSGMWLTGAKATQSVREPVPGHPMTLIEFDQQLPAGQYLLTCYGGPEQTWTDSDDSHPLYVRRGLRIAGIQGRYSMTVSPFGRERLLIPGQADYCEVRRADKVLTSLTRSNELDAYWGRTGYISKESREPIASIDDLYADDQLHWLVVETAPGSKIELQHFSKQQPNPSPQRSLVVTQSAFARESYLEPTGFVYTNDEDSRTAVHFVRLGNGIPFARRTQLTGNLEVYVEVIDTGEYTFETFPSSTASTEIRLQPLFHGDNYTPPPFRSSDQPIKLAAGRYLLELRPIQQGILDFSMQIRNGATGKPVAPEQVAQSLIFDVDPSKASGSPTLLVVGLAGVASGRTVRSLPLDLAQPLPFSLAPGASFASSFTLTEPALLHLEGDTAQLALNDRLITGETLVPIGTHRFLIRNTAERTGFFQLSTVRPPSTTVPLTMAAWLKPSQQPDTMSATQPRHFDLSASTPAFALLTVDKPGLYRIETSGRLKTMLIVRSRIDVNLFTDSGSGVGRNALIQQYLRTGTYLVTALAQGNSKGRCGLHLRRTEPIQSEPLAPGSIRRHSLREDEAVMIPIKLDRDANWRFHCLGLDKTFGVRLEDRNGFPVFNTAPRGDFDVALSAGEYRLISLPEATPSRRLFQYEEVPAPRHRDGKGPFVLHFNQPFEHIWRLGEPDQYRLQVPAELELTLTLTEGMKAVLSRGGQTLASVIGGQPFRQKMGPGELSLSVERMDPDDRFPYSLSATTTTLCSGVPLTLPAPTTAIPVSLAGDALVRLQSFGARDLQAVLRSLNGTVVASADDSPDDWNFKIMRNLSAGHYLLDLSQRGAGVGPVRIDLQEYHSETQNALNLPFTTQLQLDGKGAIIPIQFKGRQMAQFRLSGGSARFTLLRDQQPLIEGIEGQLVLEPGGDYRLVVWSEDERPGSVRLAVELPPTSDHALSKSQKLSGERIWHVTDTNAGSWWVESAGPVRYAEAPDRPFQRLGKAPLNLFSGEAWLIGRDLSLSPVVAEAGRLEFPLGSDPLTLRLQAKPNQAALVVLTGTSSHPAAQVKQAGASALPIAWSTMAATEHGTVLGLPSNGVANLRIWPLHREPGTVRLNLRSYPVEGGNAPATGTIQPGKALRMNLDKTTQALHLLLGQGLVAVYQQGEAVHTTLAALDRHLAQTLAVNGGSLTLINSGEAAQIYELRPATASAPLPLGPDGFERLYDGPGQLSFKLEDRPGQILEVVGDHLTLRWRGADGQYHEGENQLSLPAKPATLELEHGAGLVKLAYRQAGDQRSLWQTALPTRGALPNQPFDLGEGGNWTLDLQASSLLRIETRAAAVALPSLERYASGALTLATFMPAGQHTLFARPLAGTTGAQLSAKITPLNPLAEDAPWRLLGEGDDHGWSFTVAVRNKVGVGIEGDADRLQAALYDAAGRLISTSPYYLGELEPGNYVLVVSGHGAPVRYRPLLLGAKGPGQAIPDDVRQSYLNPLPTKAEQDPRPDDGLDQTIESADEEQE